MDCKPLVVTFCWPDRAELGKPSKDGRGKLSVVPEGLDKKHLAVDFRLLARAHEVIDLQRDVDG